MKKITEIVKLIKFNESSSFAHQIRLIHHLAERSACHIERIFEAADQHFDKKTAKRNVKFLREIAKSCETCLSEHNQLRQRSQALYEELSMIIGRYYKT